VANAQVLTGEAANVVYRNAAVQFPGECRCHVLCVVIVVVVVVAQSVQKPDIVAMLSILCGISEAESKVKVTTRQGQGHNTQGQSPVVSTALSMMHDCSGRDAEDVMKHWLEMFVVFQRENKCFRDCCC